MINKYEIVKIIEKIAPPETAEPWDLSGWIIETARQEISRVMLCLTVTKSVIQQAKENNCDMIISHHPLFTVPLNFYQDIDIYCAHTNLDKAACGTTETLIKELNLSPNRLFEHEFLRICDTEITISELIEKLKKFTTNIRYTNPQNIDKINRIAFCAGSGTEFWHDAQETGAEVFITGDLKFHTALDSEIAIIDIGHYESEKPVVKELATLLEGKAEIYFAQETNPIKQINC